MLILGVECDFIREEDLQILSAENASEDPDHLFAGLERKLQTTDLSLVLFTTDEEFGGL